MLHLYAIFMEFVMSLQTLINALLIFVCYICMQFSWSSSCHSHLSFAYHSWQTWSKLYLVEASLHAHKRTLTQCYMPQIHHTLTHTTDTPHAHPYYRYTTRSPILQIHHTLTQLHTHPILCGSAKLLCTWGRPWSGAWQTVKRSKTPPPVRVRVRGPTKHLLLHLHLAPPPPLSPPRGARMAGDKSCSALAE